MPDDEVDEVQASDLPIALYLNQRVTFDLLAALEDGFAHLTTVQESSSDARSSDLQGEAGLGISNVFAFLGITLGAKASRGATASASGTTTADLVHTPTSLFARLRQELMRRELVKTIGLDRVGFDTIQPGDFIEFEATLRRSPLVAVFSAFRQLIPMMEAFTVTAPSSGARKGQRAAPRQPSESQTMVRQIDTLLQAVTSEGSQDLVADCGSLRFVLTAEQAYFVDPTMNDVIDGTFRVFGKVTRVVPEGSETGISLLRKTALGNFGEAVEKMGETFASLPDTGFTGQSVQTEIPAPTLQVIPVAIFA